MNIKHLLILFFFLGLIGSAKAQDTTYVKVANSTKPVSLSMPIMMEDSNLKGEKFGLKELMATSIQLPMQKDFTYVMNALNNEFKIMPSGEGNEVRFLSFQVAADRYSKATIQLTTPDMLELYIEGKKEGSKTTTEENSSKAKFFKKDITLLPFQAQNIVVKYFTSSKETEDELKESALKIAVITAKSDSLTQITTAHDGKRNTNLSDNMTGVRVSSTRISPDGKYTLISYYSVDKSGKYTYFTELYNLKTGNRKNMGNINGSWMPHSNKYYYTKQYRNATQLISVNPDDGSETILAENIPTGGFRFSPDEKSLYFFDKEENDTRTGDFKLLKSPNDRQPGYMTRYFLSKYDLENGVKQRINFGNKSTSLNDISSDSRYLLFSSYEETITERPFRQSSLYMLDMESMKLDTLWTNEKFAYSGSFSPDMKSILITGAPEAFDGIGLNIQEGQTANSYDIQAYIMDLDSKKITPITKDFNPSIKSAFWNKVDNLIYLNVADKDCEKVYTYNTKNNRFTKLDMPEDVISSFSPATNAQTATYVGKSTNNPTRAYAYDYKSGKSTLLSDPMGEFLENVELGEVKDWSFTSSDGTTIEGFYHLPPNFDSSKKYPMIVYYYGGTTPTTRTFEHPYSMHNFASLGYVVYTVQPSGTIGYGQEFSARHVNAWGIRTADDIIEGVQEFVKQHDFVNEKKIGCVGASYGGFMTMYLQTRTDIFAAAISHAGISALSSYWGEGYWGFSYSSAASAHSYPWNNKELYVEQSPLFNADKVKTPILFTHGTVDTNVPIGESIQMYTALKILGKPVEFLQVKDENHGIAKYERRIHWSNSMYAWFDKWLKDQPQWWDAMYPDKK